MWVKNEFIFCPNYLYTWLHFLIVSLPVRIAMQTALETTYMLLQ